MPKAIRFHTNGGPDVLKWEDVEVGKPGKGVVKVLAAGSTLKGTGTVKIFMGTKVVGQGTLSNGQVTITLMKLAKGKHTLTIKYLGSANVKAGSKSFTITQK